MSESNVPEILDLEMNQNSAAPPPMQTLPQEGPSTGGGVPQVPLIDVEAIDDDDDDVIESSPMAFAQAKDKARRTARRNVVDVNSEIQNLTVRYASLESLGGFHVDMVRIIRPPSVPIPEPQPQRKEKTPEPSNPPTFDCPICMGPLEEEMSTKCGHIFCKKCIKSALTRQRRCPTCRKKVTLRSLIRVFLPTAN